MEGTQYPFTSISCADPRLNKVLRVLDGDIRHRERRFGGGLIYCVNPLQLSLDLTIAKNFEGVTFQGMIILSHDDCAMLKLNKFCASLRDARQRLRAEGVEDEIVFQVGALRKVAENFPNEKIPLYFGTIRTKLAEEVHDETTIDEVLGQIIVWVDDKRPPRELFNR
jgi:hypothetical protein